MAFRSLERCVTALLERLGRRMWGATPRLMAPTVHQLGTLRALRWFMSNMPRYLWTLRVFGGLRTHLVGAAISLINGCPYCTYGQAYAFQLIHLRERGVLFPLDEHSMGKLCGQPPAIIRCCLIEALELAGLHAEAPVLDRAITLSTTPDLRPTDRDDIRLAHLVRMLGTMNEIGIANGVHQATGEALDTVNKDGDLKQQYTSLRAAA